jgi:hypothetical protein
MNAWKLLLIGVVGWTALGMVGLMISWVRYRRGVPGEQTKLANGSKWLVSVWAVYLAVVIGVSIAQPRRVVTIGQEQCFDEMCFTVAGLEEVPRFLGKNQAGDGSRLIRVRVQVRNAARGKAQSAPLMRAYLEDAQGRRWTQSKGVSGNRLSGRVPAGSSMVSEPVFRVAADASDLGLVLTRGRWQPGSLVIGDTDSLFHRKTVVTLTR